MMTEEKAIELGYTPMAKWLSGGDYGVDPKSWGSRPAYVIPQALKRAGLKLADMEVMECNEAFAVQNLAVIKELEKQMGEKINMEENWNPNGRRYRIWSSEWGFGRPYLSLRDERAYPKRGEIRLLQFLLRRRTRRSHGYRESSVLKLKNVFDCGPKKF